MYIRGADLKSWPVYVQKPELDAPAEELPPTLPLEHGLENLDWIETKTYISSNARMVAAGIAAAGIYMIASRLRKDR
jgi:hypothetical protein